MGSSGNALCGSLAGDAVSADGEESPTITSAPRAAAAVPACIPRFIANLNAEAQAAGLSVETIVEPSDTGPQLWSKWRGSKAQFLTFVKARPSFRLPQSRVRLNFPGESGYYSRNALIGGYATVNGDEVLFDAEWGPAVFAVTETAGVEIITYSDLTLYHGSPDDLLALGILRARLPLGRKASRSNCRIMGKCEEWRSRRQPDGSIVYRVERPEVYQQRKAEDEARMQQTQPAPAAAAPEPADTDNDVNTGPATTFEWKSRIKRFARMPSADCFRKDASLEGGDDCWDKIYGTRFRFDDRDIQRFGSIIARARDELYAAIDAAAVIDTEAPQRPSFLRLVVNNASA